MNCKIKIKLSCFIIHVNQISIIKYFKLKKLINQKNQLNNFINYFAILKNVINFKIEF